VRADQQRKAGQGSAGRHCRLVSPEVTVDDDGNAVDLGYVGEVTE